MSQNRNGNGKQMPQRKPYQSSHSPYRLNSRPATTSRVGESLPPQETSRVRALRFPRLRRPKRAPESTGSQHDADPRRKILKDRLPDEIVLKFYRRSKWQIFYLGAFPAILTVITFVAFLVSAFLPLLNIFAIPLLIMTLLWWAWTIIDWENDYLILTSKRFVHIEKVFLFESTRDEIRSVDFTEVKLEAKRGSLEFAFQIGTIVIQGKGGTITFNRVAKPDKIYQEIDNDYKERRKSRRKERDEYMDGYFLAKAKHNSPPAPNYAVDIPHLDEKAGFIARTFSGKPVVSIDDMKRKQIVWRKHPFLLIKSEFIPLVLALIYLIGLVLGLPLLLGLGGLFAVLTIPAALILAAILLAVLWYRYDDWENDVYILNVEEVIDSEKLPFGFNEFKDRVKLASVQEIQLNKPGILANIFNYGSVQVNRIGSSKPLSFHNIPNPDAVQMQIGRWKDARVEIAESMEDQRIVDFLVRHRHNLHHLLEED